MNSIRIVAALVRKDLRLHGLGILLVGLMLIVTLSAAFKHAPTNIPRSANIGIYNFNFIGAMLWTEWLVSREKTKGTIAWLRTLPISDSQIVSAKFVSYLLIAGSIWMTSTFLLVPWFWTRAGFLTSILAFCALAAFGSMQLGARWRFRQKVGHVLPVVVLLLPVALIGSANDRKVAPVVHVVQWASTAPGKLVVSGLLLTCSGLCCAWTARWVSRSDTENLMD